MIYKAYELLAKLRLLTLSGIKDGDLEFIGTSQNWMSLRREEESILRDWDIIQLIKN